MEKRSKKRNKLTTNKEITRLAYDFHLLGNRLRTTISEINITAAYRVQIARHLQWMLNQAKSLGNELQAKNPNAFLTKESTEKIAEQLGLFDWEIDELDFLGTIRGGTAPKRKMGVSLLKKAGGSTSALIVFTFQIRPID